MVPCSRTRPWIPYLICLLCNHTDMIFKWCPLSASLPAAGSPRSWSKPPEWVCSFTTKRPKMDPSSVPVPRLSSACQRLSQALSCLCWEVFATEAQTLRISKKLVSPQPGQWMLSGRDCLFPCLSGGWGPEQCPVLRAFWVVPDNRYYACP